MTSPRFHLDANSQGFGLPHWSWPLIGLTAGLALVIVINETCFQK
jgi:hypothetical protein